MAAHMQRKQNSIAGRKTGVRNKMKWAFVSNALKARKIMFESR